MMKQGITFSIGQELSWDAEIFGKQIKMTASMELLDKDKAQEMLSRPYGNQRTLDKANVSRLTQAMNNDEFIEAVINPIFISDTGLLLDGQNRLTALSHTNETIPFFVVRGLPEEAFVYLDQNRPRGAKDAMKVRGIRNAETVASTTKLIYLLREGRTSIPRNEVLDRIVADYPELENAVAKAGSMKDKTHIVTSVGGAMIFLYAREYPEIYGRFFELLQYGGEEMKNSRHPVARLSKKLNDDWIMHRKKDRVRMYDNRWRQMAYIHLAFMAYTTGKYSFSWNQEQMAIDAIGQLCRKTIIVRHSYKDSFHSALDEIVEHYDDD